MTTDLILHRPAARAAAAVTRATRAAGLVRRQRAAGQHDLAAATAWAGRAALKVVRARGEGVAS